MRALKITKQITNRQSDSIEKYLFEISKIPLINAEEEVKLAQKIKNGDAIALERLVQANLRFVVSVAKQYQHSRLTLGDLINEGNLGLIKAAQRFDESRGFKFISYAVWWIRQSIMHAVSENSRIVRVPQNQIGALIKINNTSSTLEQKFEREPSLEELSVVLNIPTMELSQILKTDMKQASIDAPFESNSDYCLLDLLEDNTILNPDFELHQTSLKEDIRRAVSKLPKQMGTVVTLYYGLNGTTPMMLEDIGKEMNISRERVRQIKNQALKRLMTASFSNTLKSHYV
ncbi:MAG: RNA polymerase sigma factor RpoD/SigA [Sporocytophaga sp.]|uniref:sigma-70 family RNA polymerase sigma factor n=1 Tax=Sporocytophaga sp. TaxID=2231183 RepID=UPI001B1EC84D|nr:RNA polymerase sigma factor RpoD/SigA [Sporocytophaga sp.]MBO9701962.1 RNA polymerase sigma factor RpoD/SigA [Sporocytophaga sp.]